MLADAHPPFEWDRLRRHLPYERIEQALQASGSASIRRRRLPTQQVMWLVIALALYRPQSISEVVDALELAVPAPEGSLSARVPSPWRDSAPVPRRWRGSFMNAPGTGPTRTRHITSSRDSRCSQWTAPRCARPTVQHYIIPAKSNTRWEVLGG
ncbi:transposase domain-containing protein [Paraburkholderia silvatlantica]|uniref:transposase domain-containing protein n=1 Tax=Paraburkholderia silvatlantica TaxID=321895 RepID=UPI003CC81B48